MKSIHAALQAWCRIGRGLLALGLVGSLVLPSGPAKADKKEPAKKPKPFKVGKETTWITEPLDKDGYVDYAAALNERMRKGVTPQNNACVLLWQAIGPKPRGKPVAAEVFELLKMQPPPEKGEYFVGTNYLEEQLKVDRRKATELDIRSTKRPWTGKEYPELAAWLKANEKPLTLAVEASKRTKYFSPLVPDRTAKERSGLANSPRGEYFGQCRGLAQALVARAMLRAGEGNADDAWQDLLACHRLGRLISQGGTLFDYLLGFTIEGKAYGADLILLRSGVWNAKQAEGCMRDLRALAPLPPLADRLDPGERFCGLDGIRVFHCYGVNASGFSGAVDLGFWDLDDPTEADFTLPENFFEGVSWEPALPSANRWYDRLASALRESDRPAREKKLEQFEAERKALKKNIADKGGLAKYLAGESNKAEAAINGMLSLLLIKAVRSSQNSADRSQQSYNNTLVAFALAQYHGDHKRYPKQLDDLAPKYLPKVPPDLFSGKPLIYRPSENGNLFYSVGVNGKDDDGGGDDMAVRMPAEKN